MRQVNAHRSAADADGRPRRIFVLGCTGSIGTSAAEVIEHLRAVGERIEVVGLAAGRRADAALAQAQRLGATAVAIATPSDEVRPGSHDGIEVVVGPDAAVELVDRFARPGDLVIAAMVGYAGLSSTIAAIERGCDIALANKETLVAAGALVMPMARAKGVRILPVDSEHSAIAQCMASGGGADEVRRLVITASGGPFRTWSAERIRDASVEQALNHPTWSMGPKVTIDSASMMNKALEMIEAHWLFGIDGGRIEPIVHPQSIVHSFVEFRDGSTIAQLSPPDMKLPIQVAITHPRRVEGVAPSIDWANFSRLDFEPVDDARFPAIGLARRVLAAGGTSGAVLNAANEVAVAAFLDGRIPFGGIAECVAATMDAVPAVPVGSIEDIERADRAAREACAPAVPHRS